MKTNQFLSQEVKELKSIIDYNNTLELFIKRNELYKDLFKSFNLDYQTTNHLVLIDQIEDLIIKFNNDLKYKADFEHKLNWLTYKKTEEYNKSKDKIYEDFMFEIEQLKNKSLEELYKELDIDFEF